MAQEPFKTAYGSTGFAAEVGFCYQILQGKLRDFRRPLGLRRDYNSHMLQEIETGFLFHSWTNRTSGTGSAIILEVETFRLFPTVLLFMNNYDM